MGYTQWNLQNGAVISQRSNRASESQGARGHGQKHQRWEDKTPPLAIISTPGLTKAWAVQLGTIWASINQTLSLAYLAYPPVSKHGFYVPWFSQLCRLQSPWASGMALRYGKHLTVKSLAGTVWPWPLCYSNDHNMFQLLLDDVRWC